MSLVPHALFARSCSRLRELAAAATFVFASVAAAQSQAAVDFDLPAQPLESSLRQIADSQKLQMIYVRSDLNGVQAPAVKGRYTPAEAIAKLTEGTGLTVTFNGGDTVVIKPKANGKKDSVTGGASNAGPTLLAQAQNPSAGASDERAEPRRSSAAAEKFEKIEVAGSRLPRTATEGAQDVKIYSKERIESSGQRSVAAFLGTLPEISLNSAEGTSIATTVRLRGLPGGNTLILINGRRVQSTSGTAATNGFFDLNIIPLAAVERIEVLPTGSSAIYGGDALAGVVNIVLKKEFEGVETNLGYTFAKNTNEKSASVAAGRIFDHGSASFVGSFSRRSPLYGFDRAVVRNAQSRFEYANPGNVYAVSGNLPGLNSSFAAVPSGTGVGLTPASFAGTAGTQNLIPTFAEFTSFLPASDQSGLLASGSYRVSPAFEVYAEALFTDLKLDFASNPPLLARMTVPASNAFNPFGVPVRVSYLVTDVGVTHNLFKEQFIRPLVGVRGDVGGEWTWDIAALASRDKGTITQDNQTDFTGLTAALASSNPATAFNVFGSGAPAPQSTLNSLFSGERTSNFLGESKILDGFVRGPLFSLPSGSVDALLGGEYERSSLVYNLSSPTDASRTAQSAFAELRIPLIGSQSEMKGNEVLAAQGAARYDRYSDFGTKTTYQGSVEFRPRDTVLFRGTYGTSFKPPTLFNEFSQAQTFQQVVFDPLMGGQGTLTSFRAGGNRNLVPITGKSNTLGLVFSPKAISGLNASLTWWEIQIENVIGFPSPQFLVNNESTYPGRVTRAPSSGGLPGQITFIDSSYINFGTLKLSGIDGSLEWRVLTRQGEFRMNAAASYITRYDAANAPGSPLTNRVSQADSSGNWAPRIKSTMALGWKPLPALSATITGRFVGPYHDYADRQRILGKFWYADASIEYKVGRALGLRGALKDMKASVNVANVFDKLPDPSTYTYGFDIYTYDLIGRSIAIRVGTRF